MEVLLGSAEHRDGILKPPWSAFIFSPTIKTDSYEEMELTWVLMQTKGKHFLKSNQENLNTEHQKLSGVLPKPCPALTARCNGRVLTPTIPCKGISSQQKGLLHFPKESCRREKWVGPQRTHKWPFITIIACFVTAFRLPYVSLLWDILEDSRNRLFTVCQNNCSPETMTEKCLRSYLKCQRNKTSTKKSN